MPRVRGRTPSEKQDKLIGIHSCTLRVTLAKIAHLSSVTLCSDMQWFLPLHEQPSLPRYDDGSYLA